VAACIKCRQPVVCSIRLAISGSFLKMLGQNDRPDLENALGGFEPNELETIHELLRGPSTSNPQVMALRRIASQSLAHIMPDDGPASSSSSQENRQAPSANPDEPPSAKGGTTVNKVNGKQDNLEIRPVTNPVNLELPENNPSPPQLVSVERLRANETGQQYSRRPRIAKVCVVCGCDKDVYRYRRLMTCCNCRNFFKRANREQKRFSCTKNNNCEIVWRPRSKNICSSCRLKKAIDLGLLFTDRSADEPTQEDDQRSPFEAPSGDPESIALDEDIELQLALEASLVSYNEDRQWDRAQDFVDLAQDRPVAQDDVAETDRGKRALACLEELDECDLPPCVLTNFNHWFYAEHMAEFEPGCRKAKTSLDEVEPKGCEVKVAYSNDVHDHGINLLTSDLDAEKPTAVEEIVIPIITLSPSEDLVRAHKASQRGLTSDNNGGNIEPIEAGDAIRRRHRPRLTFKLETRRTTIDRRPMLKKLKTSRSTSRSQSGSPSGVTSTSLIAPGEDCDDSDDNDILEVDCD
jgi:hypothetical protein